MTRASPLQTGRQGSSFTALDAAIPGTRVRHGRVVVEERAVLTLLS